MRKEKEKQFTTKKMTFTAMFIALGVLLPMAFHSIPNGWIFLPMHIPVLIAGLFAGPISGVIAGALTPVISSLLTSMPPAEKLFVMVFELAAYGYFAGYFQHKQTKDYKGTLISLLGAMLMGRVVYGIASYIHYHAFMGTAAFSLKMFFAGAFVKVILGIVIQIVFIPFIVGALRKSLGEHYFD